VFYLRLKALDLHLQVSLVIPGSLTLQQKRLAAEPSSRSLHNPQIFSPEHSGSSAAYDSAAATPVSQLRWLTRLALSLRRTPNYSTFPHG
jgi:hypothetical protein